MDTFDLGGSITVGRLAITGIVALLATSTVALGARAPLPVGLAGRYVATIESPTSLSGKWTLTIRRNGNYSVVHRGASAVRVAGQLRPQGRYLSFLNEHAPGRGGCGPRVGTYRWSLKGRTLRFARVTDHCGGRPVVLVSAPFLRR